MTLITLATKEACKLWRKTSREHPDPANVETYWSPNQEIELSCTTDEREDLERTESAFKVDADVFEDPAMFAKLLAHLRDYGLKLV